MDAYAILGISRDAKPHAIRRAFRELALRYHPDRPHGSAERFRAIARAYAELAGARRAAVLRQVPTDPRFEAHGADLWCTERITPAEAVLGTVRAIPTASGEVSLVIPAGTQPGAVLQLDGRGLPGGDLFIEIEVRIPDHPGVRERALYEALRAAEQAPDEAHAHAGPTRRPMRRARLKATRPPRARRAGRRPARTRAVHSRGSARKHPMTPRS